MPSLLLHGTLLLAPVLISALWQAALLALATAAFLRLLPTLSAAARSRIWTAAFLLAAVLPFVALLPARSASTPVSHSEFHATLALAVALVTVWFATSALRATQLIRSALHLHGIARRANPVASSQTVSAEICTSTEVGVPAVAGFFHPRILIPAALYPTLSPDDLRHIILHESEHLRRRDDWFNLLQKLALVLFPVSPALLWMERRLCLERELACDDGVLRATGATRAYATTLANLAEHGFLRRTLSLALGVIGAIRQRSEVARRVHRILARPTADMPPRRAALASTLALMGIVAAGFAFTRVPELVAFSAARPVALAESAASTAPAFFPSVNYRPTLVRATMPVARPVLTAYPVKRVRAHVIHHTKPSNQSLNAPRIVLTGFHTAPTAGFPQIRITRVRFTSDDTLPQFPVFTYAAVPVRSGWLIIQL